MCLVKKWHPIRRRGTMDFKSGLFLVALAIGCAALPTQPEDDMSIFFEHVDRNARIVGGNEAPAGSHPHMVALTNGLMVRSFLCGGSLITTRTILTAAHCIEAAFSWGALSTNLRVTVGTNRWNSGGQTYAIARNVTHQHYMSSTIKNDIGVLITTLPVTLSAVVQPLAMSYEEAGGGIPAKVAGWGRIRAGGALSATLLELSTATISGAECVAEVARAEQQLNMRAPPVEPHIEICTFHSAGRGTCNGDSGSALIRTDTNQQIGVVSWGFPCALGAPDMYARIFGFLDWLQQHTQH